MRITIEVAEGELTSVNTTSPSAAQATGSGQGDQPANMQVINAGPAPVISAAGSSQAGGTLSATASDASGEPTEGISAGPAPAGPADGPRSGGTPPRDGTMKRKK
jgi:hypothetical protein